MMRYLYVLILLGCFSIPHLFAAEVTKVKGSGALINLQGEAASPGDVYYTLDGEGKKVGLLQISKVKGDKAIGRITKGKVDVGMLLQLKGASTQVGSSGHSRSRGSSSGPTGRSYWGLLVGLGMDKMSAQVNDTSNLPKTKVSLSGMSFSAMGLFDYEAFPQIWFRGLGGLEGFSVTGTAACGPSGTEACNANIYYLSADFIARYVFSRGMYRPWLGAGLALMFPASKKSTALASDSISNTNVIMATGGLDWFISPKLYIPISIEYGLLPKSNEVDASWIEFRAGFAVPF